MFLWRGSGCWHFHFLKLEISRIADNWLIIHNFNRLANQRAGKVLRHPKVLRHRVASSKVRNWNENLVLPVSDFAKGCRLCNSLWTFESHWVTWVVMRTCQRKILRTTCAGVRFPFLDFYFPWLSVIPQHSALPLILFVFIHGFASLTQFTHDFHFHAYLMSWSPICYFN